MDTNDDLLTIRDIIDIMSVTRMTVYRWIATKGLPAVKIGKTIRINRVAFEKWLEERNEYKDAERSE
jgi:excisionase family DNA binding protein